MNKLLQQVRAQAESTILSIMARNDIRQIPIQEIDVCESPVMYNDPSDVNNTMTLDFIEFDNRGKLVFGASSCRENRTWNIDDVPTDALVEVAEYLKQHESALAEIDHEL